MNYYQINDCTFCYNQHQPIIIHGHLAINAGDVVLLQGASGSGKSTLLQILAGIIPHLIYGKYSGDIKLYGHSIADLGREYFQEIAYLAQNPHAQIICSTIYYELAFVLENQNMPPLQIIARIKDYIDKFNLTNLVSKNINELSVGEKQLLNLHSLLIQEPKILLLDEPTAFLDGDNANHIAEVLSQYYQKNPHCAMIIIEHQAHFLDNIINKICTINAQGNLEVHATLSRKSSFTHAKKILNNEYNNEQISTKEQLLAIKGLNFSYKDNKTHRSKHNEDHIMHNLLLRDINLTIYKNTVTAIMGNNGSGKSTLLKLISKTIKVPNASIFYQHQDINKIANKKYWQELTLLWQNPEEHFFNNTVLEEVHHNEQILLEFNLQDCAAQNPFCLSEGQKRRLSLAIIMQNSNAKLLIMDEPSFGQDDLNKEQLLKIFNFMKLKKSLLIVSNDLQFLQLITNRIYVIEKHTLKALF